MDNQQPDMEEMSVWVRRRINRVFRGQAGLKIFLIRKWIPSMSESEAA